MNYQVNTGVVGDISERFTVEVDSVNKTSATGYQGTIYYSQAKREELVFYKEAKQYSYKDGKVSAWGN